ncbi:peptide/nickel transport system permease protein [Cohaesibacter sp. ES.047]|uniref:ABC transporter permease n=1 Tax=Cohaesibacter sp. ES.047 TaxID=1798205 RepID=UPI000BB92CFE|nr:ABC transporter permease [Cohaesibacter sp. ES.047]SNY92954.1 peptide/nickel transport system permease protein [Cohaesibacter sp. ES.047]
MTDNTLDLQQDEKQFSLVKDAFDRLIANKLAVVGMLLVLFLFFIAIFGPSITPYDFLSQDLLARNQGPSLAHWMGTDDLGRDICSRVIYGARTAVVVAFSTTFLSLIIGLFMGSLGGYFGGKIDAFVVWLIDITMSIPSLLLVIVINVSMKPRLVNWMDEQFLLTGNSFYRNTIWVDFVLVFGSLALIKWPKAARIIRGQILSVRNKNYVVAAEAIGVPTPKIVWKYVIPNSLGPIIVYISAALGEAMVFESSFSFLGVGVRPPIPSWGNMISDGLRVWQLYPHILAAPAAVLALVTIAFSFLGDGLNDALNPRQWK